jgi:hypothetical protein
MELWRGAFRKAAIARCAAGVIICGCSIACSAQSSELSLTKYASDLEALQKLTTESASKQADSGIDVAAATLRCARESEQVQTYSSYVQLRDRSKKELASNDYVGVRWSFDSVRPDRYHVVQTSGDYVDEWITMGVEHFDSLGFAWVKGGLEPNSRPELNRKLGMRKYVDVLKKLAPSRTTSYLYSGRQYLRLVYLLSIPGDFGSFFEGTNQPVQLVLWIITDSGRLVKAQTVLTAKTSSETLSQEFEQEFVGYGADVRIEKPKQVMEAK